MHILKAEIYGFGKWVDRSFDFTSTRFQAFYGENESGKSTLQQFFLFILFGLPPKRRQHFESKYSSRFGGRLTIEHDQNNYTIERTKNGLRILTEDGEEDEAFLDEILYGLTRDSFESIYAFTALQLSEIQQMKVNELNDVLFSVGLTGSTNIYKVEKALDQKLTTLYKQRGWKAAINEQIQVVEKKYQHIRSIQANETSYNEKVSSLGKLQDEWNQLEKDLKRDRVLLRMKEKHMTMFQQKEMYSYLQKERAQWTEIKKFPEEGIQRLERVKQLLLPVQSEANVLQQQVENYETTYKQAKEKTMEESVYQLLSSFLQEKVTFVELQKEMNHLTVQIEQMEEALREKLTEIPLGVEEMEEIVLPFHMDQTVSHIKQQEEALQREETMLREEKTKNETEIDRLCRELEAYKEDVLDESEMEEMQTANKMYDHHHLFQSRHHSQQDAMTAFTEQKEKQSKQMMYASFLLVIVGVVSAILTSELGLFIGSFIVLLAGVGQYVYGKSNREAVSIHDYEGDQVISESEYMRNEQMIQGQQHILQQIFLLESELKKVRHADLLFDNKWEAWKAKRAQLDDRIETECFQYPFLQQVEVYIWDAYIRYIREIKELLQMKKETELALQKVKQSYTPLENKRLQLEEAFHHPGISIQTLEIVYEEAKENRHLVQKAEEEIAERRQTLLDLEQTMETYRFEIDQLLAIAEVEDEESFYKIAHDNEKIRGLEEQIQGLNHQLETHFTEDELQQLMETKETEEQLEQDVRQLHLTIDGMEQKRKEVQEAIVAIQYDIEQLEASGLLSEQIYLLEMEKTALQKLVKEWSVYKVAQGALQEAKKQYQEKYFHSVIEKTSVFFEKITSGKYTKVFAPTEKLPFQVETRNKGRYRVDELSKGTIDQLYVALRLAMNVVMQEKIKVPLIIDDAFVHFDTVRASQMVQLLQEISETQQIILFTCKDYFAKQIGARHILTKQVMKEDVHA